MFASACRVVREWGAETAIVLLGGGLFLAMGTLLNMMNLRAEEQVLFEWSATGIIEDCRVVGKNRIRLQVSGNAVASSAIRLDLSLLKPGRSLTKPAYSRKCLIDGVEYQLY
jgi:hypothetical protein